MDSDALRAWLSVLDQLTFYELFQVDPRATADDIHHAFLRFAEEFHPDAHAARIESERAMIERIFRRANEAYRVLSSPDQRARYDGILARGYDVAANASSPGPGPGPGPGPSSQRSSVATPSIRSGPTPTGPASVRAAALARAAGAPAANGIVDPEAAKMAKVAAIRASNVPPPVTLLDKVRNSGARPFVIRAEQLVKSGDPRQARIQLVLAMHMDAGNPALDEYLKQVEALIAGGRRK